LYVTPEFWSRCIGNALHDLALVRLRQTNVQEAHLWTLAENYRARAFYEKRGSRLTGRTRVVPFPPSDRRRVCPLDNAQRAARVRVTGATACPVPNRATGQFARHR
jgi:ribosomal protein S18 acetylase RimI-like enzyme